MNEGLKDLTIKLRAGQDVVNINRVKQTELEV